MCYLPNQKPLSSSSTHIYRKCKGCPKGKVKARSRYRRIAFARSTAASALLFTDLGPQHRDFRLSNLHPTRTLTPQGEVKNSSSTSCGDWKGAGAEGPLPRRKGGGRYRTSRLQRSSKGACELSESSKVPAGPVGY